MPTRTPYTSTALEVLTSANVEKLPKGWYGYATTTTNQTGITTETDLTNLTLTVTIPANRLVEIVASVPVSSATAGDRVGVNIKEGATYLGAGQTTTEQTNVPYAVVSMALVVAPSAGSHTYKLSASLGGGSTGPIRTDHANNGTSVLIVRDIGPDS